MISTHKPKFVRSSSQSNRFLLVQIVKCFFTEKKRQASLASTISSNSTATITENKSKDGSQPPLTSSSRSSSLSLSIGYKPRSKKRKTTFLNTNSKGKNEGKDNSYKSFQRGVSLSHVVFHSNTDVGSSQNQGASRNNKGPSGLSRSHSLPTGKTSLGMKKRKLSRGGSLWSKVSQNRFRTS